MQTITVIETEKRNIDLFTIDINELSLIIDDISIVNIAEFLQSYLQPFLLWKNVKASESIMLRELLTIPWIIPIIHQTLKKETIPKFSIKTRIKNCISCVNQFYKKISCASEENIDVIGVIINCNMINRLLKPMGDKKIKIIFQENNSKEVIYDLIYQVMYIVSYLLGVGNLILQMIPIKDNISKLFIKNNERKVYTETWLSVNDKDRLRFLINKLSEITTSVTHQEKTEFDITWLFDLLREDMLNTFLFSLTNNDDEMNDRFSVIKSNYIREQEMRKLDDIIIREKNKTKLYLNIIEDKFGIKKLNEILLQIRGDALLYSRGSTGGSLADLSSSVRIDNTFILMKYLTENEKKIIILEENIRQKEWSAYLSNSCPHVEILNKLKNYTSKDDIYFTLKRLSEFFNNETNTWITCNKCKFNIICPHLKEKIEMEYKKYPYEKIRVALLKYAFSNKNISSDSYEYFCNICSGKLAEIIEDFNVSDLLGRFGDLDSQLKTKIWTTVIKALNNFYFDLPIDDRVFSTKITSILYPHILNMQKELIDKKNRKQVFMENDPRMDLYIVIFVYSYLLNMVISHDSGIGLNGTKSSLKPSIYAEKVLKIIIDNYSYLINQIEDISVDFIKLRFTEAFKIIRSLNGDVSIVKPNMTNDLIYQLNNTNYLYRYAKNVYELVTKKSEDMLKIIGKKSFETIIKETLENAKNPEFEILFSLQTGREVNNNIKLDFLLKQPKINFFEFLFETQNNDAYYKNYMMMVLYTKSLIDEKSLEIYEKKLLEFNKQTENFIKDIWYLTCKSMQFNRIEVPISNIFDENGVMHNWNLMHYESGVTVDIHNKKMIREAVEEGKIDKIVDVECSVCGIMKSNILSLSDDKIWKSIYAQSQLTSFLTFYESRCPVGKLHEWKNKECVKCKLKENMTDEEKRKYYDMYANKFEDERVVENEPIQKFIVVKKDNVKFVEDYTSIIGVSKLINVEPIIIESIGSMDNHTMKEILESKFIHPETYLDQRIYKADAEVRNFLSRYKAINKHSNLPYVEELLHETKTTLSEIIDNKIPLGENYSKDFDNILNNDFKNSLSFAIQSLCRFVLELSTSSSFYKEYAKQEMKNILRNQSLFLKPGAFDWSIFDNGEIDTSDIIPEQVGDVGEDLLDESAKNNDKDNVNGETVDYDASENNPNNEVN